MLPLASSAPLQTRSYIRAVTFPGSVSMYFSRPGLGMLKAWCMASQRSSSSFHSNSGKSTTNAMASRLGSARPSLWPISWRSALRVWFTILAGPAATRIMSPTSASTRSATARIWSRHEEAGHRGAHLVLGQLVQRRAGFAGEGDGDEALAPRALANSISSSVWRRE